MSGSFHPVEGKNEKLNSYFLCSKKVIEFAKPSIISKPFKSGYSFDLDEDYYIAVIDFEIVENHYNNLSPEKQEDFWLRELVPGTMDVSTITLKGLKKNGLFQEIEHKVGLTTYKNRAITIYNLCEKYNCTPIEFINKIRR